MGEKLKRSAPQTLPERDPDQPTSKVPTTDRKLAGLATLTVISLVASGAYLTASPAFAVNVPAAANALAPAILNNQIDAANAQLEATAATVTESKTSLEQAQSQIPVTQAKLQAAQDKAAAADQAEKAAQAALAAAEQKVRQGQEQIDIVRANIARLQIEIGRLVRQAYINGGESQQLAMLLSAEDPADFARKLEALKRQSRGNNTALDQMAAAKATLAAQLEELKNLEAAAEADRNAATNAAQDAQAALTEVAAARKALDDLVQQRETALAQAQARQTELAGVVDRLIAEQERLVAERRAAEIARQQQEAAAARDRAKQSGNSGGSSSGGSSAGGSSGGGNSGGGSSKPPMPIWPGQSAAAVVALKYALSKIGYDYASGGGAGPRAYDCIGLVWRAWSVAGSKWPLMQVQDEAQSKWVQIIPASQALPGDLIMWRLNNGTDSRRNALDHIGMVVNPKTGSFVQAESTGTGIRLSNWKRESFYQNPGAFGRVVG